VCVDALRGEAVMPTTLTQLEKTYMDQVGIDVYDQILGSSVMSQIKSSTHLDYDKT